MALTSRRYPKVPKFFLLIFFILSILKSFISWFLHNFLGRLSLTCNEPSDISHQATPHHTRTIIPQHYSTDIICKILPIVKFKDIVSDSGMVDGCTGESCSVCLCEFEGEDEIRVLMNCRHIFHKSCLDDWIDYDHRTCPLCRIPFISSALEKTIIETLWLDLESSLMSDTLNS